MVMATATEREVHLSQLLLVWAVAEENRIAEASLPLGQIVARVAASSSPAVEEFIWLFSEPWRFEVNSWPTSSPNPLVGSRRRSLLKKSGPFIRDPAEPQFPFSPSLGGIFPQKYSLLDRLGEFSSNSPRQTRRGHGQTN